MADGEKPGIRRATAALSCPARKFRESLPPPLDSGHQTRILVCDPAQPLERGSTISEMFHPKAWAVMHRRIPGGTALRGSHCTASRQNPIGSPPCRSCSLWKWRPSEKFRESLPPLRTRGFRWACSAQGWVELHQCEEVGNGLNGLPVSDRTTHLPRASPPCREWKNGSGVVNERQRVY